jgi:hypothetical protein
LRAESATFAVAENHSRNTSRTSPWNSFRDGGMPTYVVDYPESQREEIFLEQWLYPSCLR